MTDEVGKGKVSPDQCELFYVTPLLLGGDPDDPKNRVWLTRAQHIEAVRYWNGILADLRSDKTEDP